MAKELGFVLITPHSLHKSRTGGILARFSRIDGLELVASRMFGPGRELVDRYAGLLRSNPDIAPDRRDLLADYVLRAFTPRETDGRPHRVMMLLFEGEDAIRKIYSAAGGFNDTQESADTVRGTYGDCVRNGSGEIVYFEPAVLVAPSVASARKTLSLWLEYAESDGGLIGNAQSLPDRDVQRTLVIIKPDNFRIPSSRPGNIIDLFSSSGLRIIGAQVHRMTLAEADQFYGPVHSVLCEKFVARTTDRACDALAREFNFPVPPEAKEALQRTLGPYYGDYQFYLIMKFMTGRWLPDVPKNEMDTAGDVRCMVLIYAGLDAVNKIRNILGPTDPAKAPPGSVRREYGTDIMINAAHASDSPENAEREMNILRPERNSLQKWFDRYYA